MAEICCNLNIASAQTEIFIACQKYLLEHRYMYSTAWGYCAIIISYMYKNLHAYYIDLYIIIGTPTYIQLVCQLKHAEECPVLWREGTN